MPPFASIVPPQTKTNNMKPWPVMKFEDWGQQMSQGMICEVPTYIPNSYFEERGTVRVEMNSLMSILGETLAWG
jgi:hypothetical protein